MMRRIDKNRTLVLVSLPALFVGCALGVQGDPPPPVLNDVAGEGGEAQTGGTGMMGGTGGGTSGGAGGSSSGASGTAGSPTGGASGSTSTGGSGGSTSTGGASGQGGSSGSTSGGTGGMTGGSAGMTGGGAGKGGSAGMTGGTAGSATGGGAGKGGSAGSATGGGAGKGTGGSGSVAFSDNFNDGNASGWMNEGTCTWTFPMDGGSTCYSGGGGSCRSRAGSTWTDQTVQVKMKVMSFGNTGSSYRAGIVARGGSGSDYYSFLVDQAGDLQLRRGTSTVSGSGMCSTIGGSLATMTWYWLRMQVSGSSSVHIVTSYSTDGASFTQAHDCTLTSSVITSGNAGVITGGETVAEFDDFEVRTP